jgi:mono/diheme cytochrome c family protein
MSPDQSIPMSPAAAEPRAGSTGIPLWLIILSFLLLFAVLVYFDQNSGWFKTEIYAPFHTPAEVHAAQPPVGGPEELIRRGQAVYANVCAVCHQAAGTGTPGQFPPLAGSEWVLGSPNRLIRIPLAGLAGPIKVKGQVWNLSMPAMGAALSDEDLAATLTFIRASWGNKASEVSPAQVKAIRAELGGRSQPESEAELQKLPEK